MDIHQDAIPRTIIQNHASKWMKLLKPMDHLSIMNIGFNKRDVDHESLLAFFTIVYYIDTKPYKQMNEKGLLVIPDGHVLKLRDQHGSSMVKTIDY